MTFPLSEADPGETEFSHGRGLTASARQRLTRNEAMNLAYPTADPDGPFDYTPYERGKAVQRTDPADPGAVANLFADPETIDNTTQTPWSRES